MNAKITEMAKYRAVRAKPVSDFCRWSEASQVVTESNWAFITHLYFVWPRIMARTVFGV